MAQWGLTTKSDDLSLINPGPKWWKERIDSPELSSDLHAHVVVHIHPPNKINVKSLCIINRGLISPVINRKQETLERHNDMFSSSEQDLELVRGGGRGGQK